MQSARIVLHIERETALHVDYCASFGLSKDEMEKCPETNGMSYSSSLKYPTNFSSMYCIQQIHPGHWSIGGLARTTNGPGTMSDRVRRYRQTPVHGEEHRPRGQPVLEVDRELRCGRLHGGSPTGIG